ncbi:MAG: motility associated factor glycosyltransferase family protein [Desulfotomaculales bacterium]
MSVSFEFLEAKNHLATVRVRRPDGTSFMLHSAYDPIAEARRLLERYPSLKEAGAVICLGLGLGYHLYEAFRIIPADAVVLVVEKNNDFTRRFRESAKALPWDRITITDREVAIKEFLYRHWEKLRKCFVFIEHPPSLQVDPEFYDLMRRRVRDYVSFMLVDVATAKALNRRVQENILENLRITVEDPGITALKDAFRGRPAVIVAAGPSLGKNVDLLTDAKGKSIIICVGTAVKPLLARHVHPDLVVTLDPTEANYRLFEGVMLEEEYLCYEPQAHHQIPPLFAGRRFAFNSFVSPLSLWLRKLYGDKGYVEPGGSVAIAAFGIACLIGADPIVFIGQDLAYTGGRTHAAGTVYENEKVDLEAPNPNLIRVPGIGGGTVITSRNMHTFLVRFEELFGEHKDRLIIDATEGGALKRGTVVLSFREAIDRYFTEEFPVLPVIKECHCRHRPDPAVRGRVREALEKTAREYDDFIPRLEEILSLADRVQELNDLAEKISDKSGKLGHGTLQALKKKGEELNALLKEVNAQAKLVDLLSLLTYDLQLLSPLPEDAPLKEQLQRIKFVYGLYLEAAKTTRGQMDRAAANLGGAPAQANLP